MCAWGPLLGCRQEGVIRLSEVLEILYQDGGNQITQLFQRALKSWKHLVGGWESLPLASTFHPCPLFPAPMWLFSEDPLPHGRPSQPGRAAPQTFPVLLSSPSLLGPKGNAGSGRARGSSISPRGKGGGERGGGRREEEFLGGPELRWGPRRRSALPPAR